MGRFLSFLRRQVHSLNREVVAFFLVCLIGLAMGYGALTAYRQGEEERREAREFRRLLVEYQRVVQRIPDRARRTHGDTRSNPLAYLEETLRATGLSPDRVGELTPAGTDGGDRSLYRLRLLSIEPGAGVSLLKTIEKDDRLTVLRFSLERTSTGSKRFDLGLRLRAPRRSINQKDSRSRGQPGPTHES